MLNVKKKSVTVKAKKWGVIIHPESKESDDWLGLSSQRVRTKLKKLGFIEAKSLAKILTELSIFKETKKDKLYYSNSVNYGGQLELSEKNLPHYQLWLELNSKTTRNKLLRYLSKEIYGKAVPDLSVMNKARAGLADYVYAVLTGYSEDADVISKHFPDGLPEGAYYNEAFPGHAIAMASPLVADGLVDYHDETEATIDQMAHDVTYFMQWTAEPELTSRKHMGIYVLLYLVIFTLLAYATKRAIWRDIH